MRNDLNWDDLGHRIEDAVNWAVNSRNYEHLNQTIRQTVEQAVDLGSEAVKKAAKTVHYQPPKTTVVSAPSVSRFYGKTGGKVVGGIVKTAIGGSFTLASAIVLITMLAAELALGAVISGGLLLPSALLLNGGIRNLTTVGRFRTYRRMLGKKTQCALDKLARAVGKDVAFVRRDVRKMIG